MMRTIGFFSSGRHDWGYLLGPCCALAECPDVRVVVLRCCDEFTPDEIASLPDGVKYRSFSILPKSAEVSAAMMAAVSTGFAEALQEFPLDILVVVGDRSETLSVCATATAAGVVLAHIHGGDRAPGEMDDANRHAITKLAHIHFPATDESARRIARLGEQDWRIYNFGSPGIDLIVNSPLAALSCAESALGVKLDKPYFVLLLHPSGLGAANEAQTAENICKALEKLGLMCICVGGNRDGGTNEIFRIIDKYSHRNKWPIVQRLDRSVFLRLIADAQALVGNSSSGMIESAAVDAIVVNVGDRQAGRQHSDNVLHVAADADAIEQLLRNLISDSQLQKALRSAKCVFGSGSASPQIARVLYEVQLDRTLRVKLIDY